MVTFLRPHSERWTIERIARLAQREVTQLRSNAAGLGNAQVVALCDQVLLLSGRRISARRRGAALKASTCAW